MTPLRPVAAGISKWRWAWVAAAVVTVLVLPFFIPQIQPQEAGERASSNADADAVMERVDADGRVTGFSILGVSQFNKDHPLEAELTAR